MTTCKEIMTPAPDFCLPNASIVEVAQLMKSKDIGPVLVVENSDTYKLVGIVTDRDLVINAIANGKDINTTKALEVMTPDPVSCKPDDDITCAIELMELNQVRRMPIIDGSGKLLGIIAQSDIANRLGKHGKTSELVEEISKPALLHQELKKGR